MEKALAAVFLLIMFYPVTAYSLKKGEGIVAGSFVRVRSGPSNDAEITGRCDPGEIVSVTGRSATRKLLPSAGIHRHGYYWYSILRASGSRGWIYGRYLFLPGHGRFSGKSRTVTKARSSGIVAGGVRYILDIAEEPSVPLSGPEGLTGSCVHGMPFFRIPGKGRSLPVMVDTGKVPEIFFREPGTKIYLYLLIMDEGVGEKISSVRKISVKHRDYIMMEIAYITQEGGGKYRLLLLPGKTVMKVCGFTHISGTSY